MEGESKAYSKPTMMLTVAGGALIGVLALAMFGTSFETTGQVARQDCDVSTSMINFHHCNKGDYAISDFCEWERKGTLRASFCGKQLAVVSLVYAIGLILVISTILGCMHCMFGSGICQFCIAIALCMLHSVSALATIGMAGLWTSAKGDLPDLTYDSSKSHSWHTQMHDASAEPGSEWMYVAQTAGFLSWGISYGVVMCYVAATLAVFCAACAFYALKMMSETLSIRVEIKQVPVENNDSSFLDHVATTGTITHTDAIAGISSAGSPPGSPTHVATVVHLGSAKEESVASTEPVEDSVEAPVQVAEKREEERIEAEDQV